MCLTVCLGPPSLRFWLLHPDCFLNLFSVSPPLVPPSLGGSARLCLVAPGWAGPHRIQPPSRGYSCLCLFARCLLFSVAVFPIITVDLAGGPCERPGGRALPQETRLLPSARLRKQVLRQPLRGHLSGCCRMTAPLGSGTLLQSAGACQHAVVEQACANHSAAARCRWGGLAGVALLCVSSPSPTF